ncbi:cytochrome c3 family protein [Paraeggerthella hongkongensis]|uniref:Histamine H3 receptor n=1 Tax=Paraeggerthella hongkongensis TaxID=230658 RepID=A0A3N0BJI5_9ACTN|nr:cytochrome c3 family protein [Paraeggerthella hongkongensis]RNL48456.1 histamine H3 receptor [Paraeggerthella hongkongensis]
MEDKQPSGKRTGRKKWPIVVAVVAIVAVAAGGGFWVWHEQPGFCNAICHDPMDAYVEGYYYDEALLANVHQRADATCLECHEANIEQQVAEGVAWVSGDFETDESGRITRTGVTADKKMCTQNGCHDWEGVVAATQDWGGRTGVNPHRSHQGEAIDCSNCHGVHEASQMYCNACHDFEVPAGWNDASGR